MHAIESGRHVVLLGFGSSDPKAVLGMVQDELNNKPPPGQLRASATLICVGTKVPRPDYSSLDSHNQFGEYSHSPILDPVHTHKN
jgi:hypothetical protein